MSNYIGGCRAASGQNQLLPGSKIGGGGWGGLIFSKWPVSTHGVYYPTTYPPLGDAEPKFFVPVCSRNGRG